MAITVTDRGTGNNNVAGTTIVAVPGSNMAAGSTGILVIAMDNANGASGNLTTTSYTDSVGNVWYVRNTGVGGGANASTEGAILSSLLTTGFTTSDSLTVNLVASTTAKAWTFTEAAPGAGNIVIYNQGLWTAVSAGQASPTITSQQITNGALIIGAGSAESADTWVGDSDTTNGSWSTKQSAAAGTGATGCSVISQSKVVTAYATQTYNPTLTAADVRVGWAQFTETEAKTRALSGVFNTEAASTISITQPLTAGSIGVLMVSADNAGSGGNTQNIPASINDSKSNTWTLRQTGIYDPGAAAAGVEIGIYTSVLTSNLVVGDTLTLTYTAVSVNGKAWVIWEFAPQSAGTMSYVTGAMGTGATTATPSVTTGTIANGDYVVGVAGAEGDNTFVQDSDTTNGTWKTHACIGVGTGATGGMAITSQWKLVTSGATQTYNPTLTSADTMIAWIEVTETAGGGGSSSASFFALF